VKLWLDAQLPPAIALWISSTFGVECEHIRGTDLARAEDHAIFAALRRVEQVIMSKDEDFADLVTRLSPPPQVLWIRLGNLTNRALQAYLTDAMPRALELLRAGEPLVEMHRIRQ
jgi:predicted nuclease of predicted toxin-antitoxin system